MEKSTVFIIIDRAVSARNMLLGGFGELLRTKYRVVLLSAMYDTEEFKKTFSSYVVEPLYPFAPRTRIKQVFNTIMIATMKGLIYNDTVELRTKYGMIKRDATRFKKFRYLVQKYIFGTLFSYNFFRTLARVIDRLIFPVQEYDALFKQYKPVAVFSPSISGDTDAMVLRNARRFNVIRFGMPKSWDNCSKFGFREKVDKLFVWGAYMKQEAITYQTYASDNAIEIGIPYFDFYFHLPLMSRDDFIAKYRLDPNKKIILVASEGPVNAHDHLVSMLRDKIKSGALIGYQILIRPHFGYREDMDRYRDTVDNKTVFMDTDHQFSNSKDGSELSANPMCNLFAQLSYCDVMITGASTIMLDAAVFGKCALLYNFDQSDAVFYNDSIKRFYDTAWFKKIDTFYLENKANSIDELVEKIKRIQQHPDYKRTELEKLIQYFCYRVDGKSAYRLFSNIDAIISNRAQNENIA